MTAQLVGQETTMLGGLLKMDNAGRVVVRSAETLLTKLVPVGLKTRSPNTGGVALGSE
jgi:hypothetical protein